MFGELGWAEVVGGALMIVATLAVFAGIVFAVIRRAIRRRAHER